MTLVHAGLAHHLMHTDMLCTAACAVRCIDARGCWSVCMHASTSVQHQGLNIRNGCPVSTYPSCHSPGAGNMTASGRVPLAMLALKELLLMYPGQVR